MHLKYRRKGKEGREGGREGREGGREGGTRGAMHLGTAWGIDMYGHILPCPINIRDMVCAATKSPQEVRGLSSGLGPILLYDTIYGYGPI